ncbi:MAG: hypothetical protein EKK41_07380 [Hyphomicrobiales bacterium]|nr:MAG: hypothetical protein EKK41_07380 [Hyphomicrobiales bacterium]
MATLTANQRRAQGDAAEQKFRNWLDRCILPHMYVEQSPLTVPKGLKGEIKRPDFLVGIPTIGTLAFDVKAKTVYDNAIIIDAYERRTFMNFETFFNMTVWYVCFPPEAPNTCHLFLNSELATLPVVERRGHASIAVPLKQAVTADPRRDFMAVLLAAISLR